MSICMHDIVCVCVCLTVNVLVNCYAVYSVLFVLCITKWYLYCVIVYCYNIMSVVSLYVP